MSYELRLEYNEDCLVNDNSSKCLNSLEKIRKKTQNINYYNYLDIWETPKTEQGENDYYSDYYLKSSWAFKDLKLKQSKMKTFKMKSFLSEENTNIKTLEVSCVDSGPLFNYFNKEEVKEALHVKKSKRWEHCSYSVYFIYYR